jgi:hypothetical protein
MKAFKITSILISVSAGSIGYTFLMGFLYARFCPFSSDIPAWIIASVPTGAILGGISAYAAFSYISEDYLLASLACMFASVPIGYFYLGWYRTDLQTWSPTYAVAEAGPALLWSMSIFTFGLFLLARYVKAKRQQR